MTEELPLGWAGCSLEQVAAWGSGGTPTRSNPDFYRDGTIPWLVIGDLNDGLVTSSESAITAEGLASSSAKLLEPGTLLVAMYGSIGKLGITGFVCATNQAIAFCRPESGIILRYLFRLLQHAKPSLILKGKGGTQQNISQGVLKEHAVRLAPTPEQQRIADKLDTVLARVDACRGGLARVAPLLKRFRQSVLTAATSGRLTEDWRTVTGHSLHTVPFERLLSPRPASLKRGPFGSSIKKDIFVSHGYKVYEQKNAIRDDETLGTYFLDEEKYSELEEFAVAPGDFIVSCAGTIGRISRLSTSAAKGVINQALMRIRIDEQVIVPEYFRMLFEAPWFQTAILEKTQGSAMQNMAAVKIIKQVPVILPSSAEQTEIVRRVENLFSFADRLEARLIQAETAVDRLTPSLLSKAFRGELVPQDPADEPAAELLKRVAAQRGAEPARPRRKRAVA